MPSEERSSQPGIGKPSALVALGICLAGAVPVAAEPSPNPDSGFAQVVLFGEEEFAIQAATKTEIPVSKAPGPVTVITARQIRESGARTIPDASYDLASAEGGLSLAADVSWATRRGSYCGACHAAPQSARHPDDLNEGFQLFGEVRAGIRLIPNHDILVGVETRRVDAGEAAHLHDPFKEVELTSSYLQFKNDPDRGRIVATQIAGRQFYGELRFGF